MATSGNFSTSNQFVKYNISATEGTPSAENNTSPLTVSVQFWRTNTGWVTYGTGTVYCRINGVLYSQAVTPNDEITSAGIVLFHKAVTIPHEDDGSKQVEISAWISHNAPLSSDEQGFTVTLTTIPRASQPSINTWPQSVSAVTIGDTIIIHCNRASSAFTHTVRYAWCGRTGLIAQGVENNTQWVIPTDFCSGIPTATAGELTITLSTYNGSTLLGEKSVTVTASIPAGSGPVFTAFSAHDANDATAAVTGDRSMLVQGYSTLQITVPAAGRAVSTSGANIVKYIASCGNRSTEAAWSADTDVVISMGAVNSGSISVAAVDSRGQQTVVQKLLTLIPYTPPVVRAISATRKNGVGEETTLSFRAEIYTEPVGQTENSVQSVAYTWQEGETVHPGATAIPAATSWAGPIAGDTDGGFSPSKSFALRLVVTDAITSTEYALPLHSGVPVLDTYRRGQGMGLGVGKRWEHGIVDMAAGDIYLGGKLLWQYVYPVGSVYISREATDPATLFGGTWERLKDRFILAAGDTYAAGTTGGEAAHKLTLEEIPEHNPAIKETNSNGTINGWCLQSVSNQKSAYSAHDGYVQKYGGGQAHNNMPPYTAFYIWIRTA